MHNLGLFFTPEGAALVYNDAARLYHKEFAVLNDVPESAREKLTMVGLTSQNTSGYKGISLNRLSGKWCATIKHRWLGAFSTPEEAAKAYNDAAIEEYGEKAWLNKLPTE